MTHIRNFFNYIYTLIRWNMAKSWLLDLYNLTKILVRFYHLLNMFNINVRRQVGATQRTYGVFVMQLKYLTAWSHYKNSPSLFVCVISSIYFSRLGLLSNIFLETQRRHCLVNNSYNRIQCQDQYGHFKQAKQSF